MVTSSGDSIPVASSSFLVSGDALARTDSTIRALRRDLETSRANEADREEQVELLRTELDSVKLNLAGERAYRSVAERLLESQQGTLEETLENFGLAALGFGVCRVTERR